MEKALIFDLDGTLWDSTEQILYSWNEELGRHSDVTSRVTKEKLTALLGKTMDKFISLFPEVSKERAEELLELCCKAENEYLIKNPGRLYEGEREILKKLGERYSLFIVSNCQKGYIEAYLEACQLNKQFLDIECYGNTGLPKAENIRILMKRNHFSKAVYIGDTLGDYQAAMEAGVEFIHASYGFGTVPKEEKKIAKLEELEEILFPCAPVRDRI